MPGWLSCYEYAPLEYQDIEFKPHLGCGTYLNKQTKTKTTKKTQNPSPKKRKKEEISQINQLILCLKKLGKEKNKPMLAEERKCNKDPSRSRDWKNNRKDQQH